MALSLAGNFEAAMKQYQEIIRRKPDYAEARKNLEAARGLKDSAPGQSGTPTKP